MPGSRIESRADAVVVAGSEMELRYRTDWRNAVALRVFHARRKLFKKNGLRLLLARISGSLVRKIHSGFVDLLQIFCGKTEAELIRELDSGLVFYGFHDPYGIVIGRFGSFIALCVRSAGKGSEERSGRKSAAQDAGIALGSGTVVLRHIAK